MLQMLEKNLVKSLPESLKVYGTVFHMNQGNAFNLNAFVDNWPDFNTVVISPQKQEMIDDLDHYTNTYQIYSNDPKHCQKVLETSDVINWKQHLQIQSTQSSLNEVIQNLGATKLVKVKYTRCILYMFPKTVRKLLPSLVEAKNLPLAPVRPKPINKAMFQLSSLGVGHAALVNRLWHFGGNERSQRFIERCIQAFPTACLLGPEGSPVSWSLMDQTGEIRMGGTVPEYRAQGLISYTTHAFVQALDLLGFPLYNHTARDNRFIQKMSSNFHHVPLPCDWNQWNCVPLGDPPSAVLGARSEARW